MINRIQNRIHDWLKNDASNQLVNEIANSKDPKEILPILIREKVVIEDRLPKETQEVEMVASDEITATQFLNIDPITIGDMAIHERTRRREKDSQESNDYSTHIIITNLAKLNSKEILKDLTSIEKLKPKIGPKNKSHSILENHKEYKDILIRHHKVLGVTSNAIRLMDFYNLLSIQEVATAINRINFDDKKLSQLIKNYDQGSYDQSSYEAFKNELGLTQDKHDKIVLPLLSEIAKEKSDVLESSLDDINDKIIQDINKLNLFADSAPLDVITKAHSSDDIKREILKNRLGQDEFDDDEEYTFFVNKLVELRPQAVTAIVKTADEQIQKNKLSDGIKNKISTLDSTEKTLNDADQDHLNKIATCENRADLIKQIQKAIGNEIDKNTLETLSDAHFDDIQNHARLQILINTITTITEKSNRVLNKINQLGQDNTQGIKDYIRANKVLFGIKDDDFISNLTPEQTKTIYLRASTQLVTNIVNDHIHQMDTKNDNNLLVGLTPSFKEGHIQNHIDRDKEKLGLTGVNNIEDIINSLTKHQVDRICDEANGKLYANREFEAANNKIGTVVETDNKLFKILKPFPTSNASEIRKRIEKNFKGSDARNFSDKQAKDISNNLLRRLGEIDHYYKFANNFSKHKNLYGYLTNSRLLKAKYNKIPTNRETEFENKLTDPTETKDNIATVLTSLLPGVHADEIESVAAGIYGENQFRRVYSGAPESLKAEFDFQNDIYVEDDKDPHELIIDKLKGKTLEQINQLVEAIKTKDLFEAPGGGLANAMGDLGLDGNRSITYFAKREYERLLKKHEDDLFLKPLLKANKVSIEETITSLIGYGEIQSIADIDTLISEIQNADKAELIPRLKDLGIVQRPADGGAIVAIHADDENELFGSLAYQHLYKLGGETLKTVLTDNKTEVEERLGEAPGITITKINELKTQPKTNIANFIEEELNLGVLGPGDQEGPGGSPPVMTGPEIELTEDQANKIFAEVQCKALIEKVAHNRPDLEPEIRRNEDSMIEHISENDEIVTPAHITSIYNEMTQATNDVDVHLAARKLGITFQDENAIVRENKKLQYEKAAAERMKDPLHFQQIRNNLDRYTKLLDHFLSQTENAKFEESNRQTIVQIQNQTHDLKVQLAAYKSQCMYKLSENPTNAVMENQILALNKYLGPGGVIEQIETNIDSVLDKLSPDEIAYYQPSSNLPEAKPVNTHEEAIAEVRKYLGSTGYQVPASILMGTGRAIPTHVEFSVVPMDIEVKPGEVVQAVSVRKKDPETKSASLDLFFKSEKEMEKLCKVPRDGDFLNLFNSVPGTPVMKWAASNVKTLRAMSDNNFAPVVISDQGLQPVLKEAIQLYCNFKGIRCQPPGNFSDAQIKKFTENWKGVDPTDLGCREIKMLSKKTTYKPPTTPPVAETTSNNNHRPQ